ncbi:MAG: 16S rRNA (guanine(527)-N(7))-methyltransferase RsmG [Muribaculaceae bacterium]|nr:16S rRNA (guanine(527)-N(7))-methyltransferase RsmG [Muribaculaceae bacterium]
MDTVNDSVELVSKYFPALSQSQLEAFARLGELYYDWNAKINVISRADTGNLYCRHVLHSLAIAKFLGELVPGTEIMDLGTGGGFPGIPLAIFYPECRFHMIDRIGKKIMVAREIAASTGLENVSFQHGDAGECRRTFDYVVSRAVMSLDGLLKACSKNIVKADRMHNNMHPGLVCLKGGDLAAEFAGVNRPVVEVPVSDYFSEDFFKTKEVVYVPFVK